MVVDVAEILVSRLWRLHYRSARPLFLVELLSGAMRVAIHRSQGGMFEGCTGIAMGDQ